jgi:hypothetical protein
LMGIYSASKIRRNSGRLSGLIDLSLDRRRLSPSVLPTHCSR